MSDFKYTVIRSRRKSFSIKITDDNDIIVRAPLNASQKDVDRVIEKKSAWMRKVFAFNDSNALLRCDVSEYRAAYVDGEIVPVIKSTRNFIDGKGVHVTCEAGFKAAYVNSLSENFMYRFHKTQAETSLKCTGAAFRSYKSRWGCCDANNAIMFNFKLLMLPHDYQHYVMVHELCHTVHHDHSTHFWKLVALYEPRYKALRAGLKKYAFLARLY